MKKTHIDLPSGRRPAGCGEFPAPINPSFRHSTIPDSNESSLIIYDDGDWSEGHYKSLFCLYTKLCLQSGMQVTAICPQPDEVRQWIQTYCSAYSSNCTTCHTGGKLLKSKIHRLKPFVRLIWWMRAGRTIRPIQRATGGKTPVLFMNINHLRGELWTDRLTDRLMPFPWCAIIFDSSAVRQTSGEPDLQKLRSQFHFLSAKNCKAFGVFDKKMVSPLQAAFHEISIVFLPDATPEDIRTNTPLSADILRKADGRKIVGLLGMLHKRKGLLTALKLAEARPDLFFVFAGAYDLNKMLPDEKETVLAFFARPPENCFCHLQRIEDEAEFNAIVQLTDLIFAVYPGFTNSSGLLTKAGIFGNPCLVADGNTCMADLVRKYNLGLCVPDDIQACSEAIDRILGPDNGELRRFKEFRTDFSEQALQTALQKLTESCLKLKTCL